MRDRDRPGPFAIYKPIAGAVSKLLDDPETYYM